ncbi:MAG: RluA family pseudouridine synthase [Polyangiaceae bacterium]
MKPAMVWTVQRGDGRRVGAIVEAMKKLGAPADGRIFLNGRPAELSESVDPGDRVELYPRRDGTTAPEEVRVLAQRDGIVLAFKPAGLPTETTRLGEDSLVSALLSHFKGGKLHAASRLDAMVSGVVTCTLGRDAARRIEAHREEGKIERVYLAIAKGRLMGEGEWDAPLARVTDRAGRHRSVPEAHGAKDARTRYRVVATTDEATLLELRPVTGRMHQLRAHAAHAGHPLYGDRRYGGPTSLIAGDGSVLAADRIALHAWRVALPHLRAEAPAGATLAGWWRALGGRLDDHPAFNAG